MTCKWVLCNYQSTLLIYWHYLSMVYCVVLCCAIVCCTSDLPNPLSNYYLATPGVRWGCKGMLYIIAVCRDVCKYMICSLLTMLVLCSHAQSCSTDWEVIVFLLFLILTCIGLLILISFTVLNHCIVVDNAYYHTWTGNSFHFHVTTSMMISMDNSWWLYRIMIIYSDHHHASL